jgi:hypothetical protein
VKIGLARRLRSIALLLRTEALDVRSASVHVTINREGSIRLIQGRYVVFSVASIPTFPSGRCEQCSLEVAKVGFHASEVHASEWSGPTINLVVATIVKLAVSVVHTFYFEAPTGIQ